MRRGYEVAMTLLKSTVGPGSPDLPVGTLCAASPLALDAVSSALTIWNGGLPAALVCVPQGARGRRLLSHHLPLGVLDTARAYAAPTHGTPTVALTHAAVGATGQPTLLRLNVDGASQRAWDVSGAHSGPWRHLS